MSGIQWVQTSDKAWAGHAYGRRYKVVLAPHDEYDGDVWQFVNPGCGYAFYAETRPLQGQTFESVRLEAEGLIVAAPRDGGGKE